MQQTKFTRKITCLIFALTFCFFTVQPVHATVPQLITYHGILKNSGGNFLTGTYSLTFRLYTASTGGTAVWTETQSSVSVSSGKFSVQLGSVTALSLAFTDNYWLSIQVGSDDEMTPRVQLTSAGYAYMAENVTGGKLTGSAHSADPHMSIEGVKSAMTSVAKTNFKLDAYSLAAANDMGDLIVDTFNDESGIDASSSSDYTWRGSSNYDVVAGTIGGIDSYVKLMLHGNGTDGSSTFTDSSTSGKSVTAVGNAQIDTAQYKFGTASAYFDGSGDYLSIPDSDDWDFGTGDFTIDGRFRIPSGVPDAGMAFYDNGGDSSNGVLINISALSSYINVFLNSGSPAISANISVSLNEWHHLALTRSGTSLKLFLDGNQIGSATNSTNLTGSTNALRIGMRVEGISPITGWIDELRVSKGIARWTAAFTPPVGEYSVPGGTTATVVSNAFSQSSAPSELILVADETLGTGSINYYASRNNGTDWTQCSNEAVCDISSQPTGSQLRWKATISGNAELDAIGLAL